MTRYPGRTTLGLGERNPMLNTNLPLPPTLGTPITEPTAIALRQIVFGQCPAITRSEFFSRGPGMVFREPEQPLSYGLTFTNSDMLPMARSVLMVIQAHLVRTLLFENDVSKMPKSRRHPLEPSRTLQKEALCSTIADILWRAGGGKSCVLTLPSKTTYLPSSNEFNQDGVTERLQVLTFEQNSELMATLRRYLYMFQEDPGPGVLLLIYSAALSRGIDRIAEDMCGRMIHYKGDVSIECHLASLKGSISYSILCLLMTGRASMFLHNGVQYRGDEDKAAIAETGILIRSPLGILVWMGTEDKTEALNVGSRLKTPLFPIWLVLSGNDNVGLLFCLDRALMRDYRNEYKFQLHYYSSSHFQTAEAILGISTRGSEDADSQNAAAEISTPPVLERIIRTKWGGARINWNGATPFF